jgi:hypothetical protein
LTGSHTLRAFRCFIYLLKDVARLLQKELARCAEFDSPRKAVEQFEAYLPLQILDLSGECRLGDAKPFRAAPVMLLLSDCHEVAQMSQFHSDSLSALVR